jgi:thymidylate synthase
MLITGWKPDNIPNLSLPCCHMLYQWYVRPSGHLDMIWYQRSVDTMVGLPSDIILAAAWNILLAKEVGLKAGKIKFMLGDTHIYENHMPGVTEYLARDSEFMQEPEYYLAEHASVFNFEKEQLTIHDYKHLDPIKFTLNV